jgi:hypothetical protein
MKAREYKVSLLTSSLSFHLSENVPGGSRITGYRGELRTLSGNETCFRKRARISIFCLWKEKKIIPLEDTFSTYNATITYRHGPPSAARRSPTEDIIIPGDGFACKDQEEKLRKDRRALEHGRQSQSWLAQPKCDARVTKREETSCR